MDEVTDVWSRRNQVVRDRARERAKVSEAPDKFMVLFDGKLSRLRMSGDDAFVHRALLWDDPVNVAAEIEAFSAYRAMRYWGTSKGLLTSMYPNRYGNAS